MRRFSVKITKPNTSNQTFYVISASSTVEAASQAFEREGMKGEVLYSTKPISFVLVDEQEQTIATAKVFPNEVLDQEFLTEREFRKEGFFFEELTSKQKKKEN